MEGGVVICNPIPEEYGMDRNYIDKIIDDTVKEAKDKKIKNVNGKIVEIKSIEDYYSNITGIVQMKKLDPSVLRIPLDEPIININADTRQIELTKEFGKTQLLAVENDHLAETIYFQIDRYFGLQDLAADDIKIYI